MKKCKKGIVLIALSVAIACFSAGCVGDGLKDKFEDWFDKSEVEESSDVEDTSSSIPEQSDCAHTYGKEPTSVVAATCTTDGREVYKCTKCGEEKVETLEKLGHNVETHAAQAATCTEIGWAEYQACTRCDYTTYEEIPALGHDYEGGVCTRCNEQDPDYVGTEGLEYTLNDDGESYTLCNIGTCTDTDIVIPSMFEGKPVTSIGGSAFASCSSLTSVTIGNGVTSIGGYAFRTCSSLTSVTIPDSVTNIGTQAFESCNSLTNITIPNNVTSIYDYTFSWCTSLTSVTIGNGVTSIGYWAFYGCSSLTSIEIPDSVTSIDHEAFNKCSSLTSLTIPNSVTSIGGSALQIGSSTNKATIRMLSNTPPTIESNTFDSSKLEKIIVPVGSLETYKTATYWSNFADYITVEE